jgi:hypothetical protein
MPAHHQKPRQRTTPYRNHRFHVLLSNHERATLRALARSHAISEGAMLRFALNHYNNPFTADPTDTQEPDQ